MSIKQSGATFLSLLFFLCTLKCVHCQSVEVGALFQGNVNQIRRQAAQVAFNMINNENSPFNFTFELVVSEDENKVANSVRLAFDHMQNRNFKALLGPNRSAQSEAVSHIATAMAFPILSYASTAESLSDKTIHPYFFRSCPSDIQQVKAWIAIMEHFNWTRCSIIASNDAYGTGNVNNFLTLGAGKFDVGVATYFESNANNESLSIHLDTLSRAEPKIIFLMAIGDDGRKVLDMAMERGLIGPDTGYTWILSEGIASVHYLFENIPLASERRQALAGSLGTRPQSGEGPLWNEFVANLGSEPTDVFVPYVVDAVYMLAHTYEYIIREELDPSNGDDIVQAFSAMDFIGTTGRVMFQNYERVGNYDIVNFQNDTDLPLKKVASWNETYGIDMIGSIIWSDGTNNVPYDRLTIMIYIGYDHPLGIAIIVLTSICIAIILASGVVLYIYENTPVMRYSSPMFLGLILIGLGMLYAHLILWVGRPTRALCMSRAWVGLLGFVFMMSALIAKTFRVYRIFKRRRKIKQVVMTNAKLFRYALFLTLPILIILSIWTALDMLSPLEFENSSRSAINITCSSKSNAWVIISFAYCGILILAATFFSYKTRKIPDGFRETHWINLACYNAFFTAIVGITIAFVLYDDLVAAHIIIFICAFIGTTFIWGLIFVPKMRVAIFLKGKSPSSGVELSVERTKDFGQDTSSIRSSD